MHQIIEELKAKAAQLEQEVLKAADAEAAKVKADVQAVIAKLQAILGKL